MRRRIIFSLLLAVALLTTPGPALAGISSEVSGGVLTVTGTDDNDVIGILCEGGDVVVGGGNPGTGPASCSDITRIVVDGRAGSDVLHMQDVLPIDFTALPSVHVDGGGGYDTFRGSPLDDELSGGDGNDEFYASAGSDTLDGSSGDDRLIVVARGNITVSDTSLQTPDGSATISGFDDLYLSTDSGRGVRFDASGFRGNAILTGGRGDDRLLGAVGRDFITGNGGADRIDGKDGWDQLFGSDGPDVILGGPGDDRLFGGRGKDRCRGGPGDNLIYEC